MTNSVKKVVIATGIYPPAPGGPATHAKKYKEYLSEKGFDVDVITYGNSDGVVSVSLGLPFGLRQLVFIFKLFRLSRGADAILGLDALGVGVPIWFISTLTSTPYVLRVGGDPVWERRAVKEKISTSMIKFYAQGAHKRVLSYHLVRLVLRKAKKVVVPTILLANVYEQSYALDPSLIEVLPNPLPPKRNSNRKEVAVRNIVFASRLVAYKNLKRLINAVVEIAQRYSDVKLVLFGGGLQESALRDHVNELGVENIVSIVTDASREEVLATFDSAALCAAPALTEFYPNYVMECLSSGVPFVISKENGLPFVVPEQAVFDAENTDDMVRAIEWGLSQEARSSIPDLSGIPSWEQYLGHIEDILDTQV